jgi:GNAT superfamily N-acetyltransferase
MTSDTAPLTVTSYAKGESQDRRATGSGGSCLLTESSAHRGTASAPGRGTTSAAVQASAHPTSPPAAGGVDDASFSFGDLVRPLLDDDFLPARLVRATPLSVLIDDAVAAVDLLRAVEKRLWRGKAAGWTDVEVLGPADWRKLRAIRLRALRDSPRAFVADRCEECKYRKDVWVKKITTSTWIIARDGEHIIAVANCLDDPESSNGRYIESVWVDPWYRRRGVVRQMLGWFEETARADGKKRLLLWVLANNENAWNAYVKLGFADDKEKSEIRRRGKKVEFVPEYRMVKNLL